MVDDKLEVLAHGFETASYTPSRMKRPTQASWATTDDVCAAAGVSADTVRRWSKQGVLPVFETVYGRGRQARWPLHAPAQAVWVNAQMDAGFTLDEIRTKLESGEFKPPQS
jgi:hypothetical protein